MDYCIKTAENGCYVINGKIYTEGTFSLAEAADLVEEYYALRTNANVYTSEVMEKKWGLPEALKSHFQRMDMGPTMVYNSDTIEKVSEHFCIIKEEANQMAITGKTTFVQLNDVMKKAV